MMAICGTHTQNIMSTKPFRSWCVRSQESREIFLYKHNEKYRFYERVKGTANDNRKTTSNIIEYIGENNTQNIKPQ